MTPSAYPTAQAPTLEDVARLAGVSRATASRAINGGDRVSPQSLVAVEQAVTALGYTPNRAARSLVTRRTDSIALVVPEQGGRIVSDPFFARSLEGFSSALEETDYQLVLLTARKPGDSERMLRYLRNGHVDGALVLSHHQGDALTSGLSMSSLPCVFGGRPLRDTHQLNYVDVDNRGGAKLAVEHLVARGRRRIATIAGPSDMAAGIDRLEGWREAMLEAGLADDLVVESDFTVVGGDAAAERLLSEHPDIDAIFAASDPMALGALRAMTAAGRQVPDDVALVGFDNTDDSLASHPGLSTIDHPVTQMAEAMAEILLHILGASGEKAVAKTKTADQLVVQRTLPVSLVIRETS